MSDEQRADIRLLTRAYRTWRVARTALWIWAQYKWPKWWRRLLGRPPLDEAQLTPTHERVAEAILKLTLELRGVLIKACQVISTRSDIFPPPYVARLKQCHDAVPAQPFDTIRAVVESELGKPLNEIFRQFEPEPLASASLAQVHRARLADGREVAVKVQYPDIERVVFTDLANMRRACWVYQRFDAQPVDLLPLVDELTKHLGMELDFLREADSADRVRELFCDDETVKVPEVYRQWSTRRVLVMELVDGLKVDDSEGLAAAGLKPALVMQDLTRVYTRMIMAAGFFQADPHPGNIFIRPDGQIVLLDFGLSKELPDGFGMGLFELMFSMMTNNESAMVRAFGELGFETRTGDTTTFVGIARRMMRRSRRGRFEGEFTEEMTDDLFEAVRENPVVRIPSDFVLVGRAFALLSGIGNTLGARANVLRAMGVGGG